MILYEILLIVVVHNGMIEQIVILVNPPLLINLLYYLDYQKEGEI